MNILLVKSAIVLLLVAVCHGDGEFQAHRRGGTNMGLFPFPRIGRSDSSRMLTYGGLIPFPRVGRSDLRSHYSNQVDLPAWMLPDNLVEYQKRNGGSNMNGGMWFGPRLGRLQKRSYDYSDTPWTLVTMKDPSGSLDQTDFAPILARESEKANDDTMEEILSSSRLATKNRNNISQ